jgi:hypothetical protein
MKNNIKATEMQLAKKHAVKPQINDVQTKKVSIKPDPVSVGPAKGTIFRTIEGNRF